MQKCNLSRIVQINAHIKAPKRLGLTHLSKGSIWYGTQGFGLCRWLKKTSKKFLIRPKNDPEKSLYPLLNPLTCVMIFED